MSTAQFRVSFDGWVTPGWDAAYCAVFHVAQGEKPFAAAVSFSGTAGPLAAFAEPVLKRALLQVGMERLTSRIRRGDYEDRPGGILRIDLLSEDLDEIEHALAEKRCAFQEVTSAGLMCAAAWKDDMGGRTTTRICAVCPVPDERVRCSAFCHPRTRGRERDDVYFRELHSFLCDQNRAEKAHQCIPGERDCWFQDVSIGRQPGPPPSDAAERLADELDFVNLVFSHKYGRPVMRFSQARSIASLFGGCSSQEEFSHKVAVLTDLVNRADFSRLPITAKPEPGSLNHLKAFLDETFPGTDQSFVAVLRALVHVRDSFPAHSENRGKLIADFDRLGVRFPIGDWDLAWGQVLHSVPLALRHLRSVVQESLDEEVR